MSFLPALISAFGSIGGGFLSGRNAGNETKLQKTQRKNIDELLRSLKGQGAYSDLFQTDDAAFQKSFVDPAKQMFRDQIAPQIQQQSIAGGQQYGSELTGDLTRAGVDLDQMLNQYLYQDKQNALNRKMQALGLIQGGGAGGTQNLSGGQAIQAGVAGTLQNPQFMDQLMKLFSSQNQQPSSAQQIATNRRGFGLDY